MKYRLKELASLCGGELLGTDATVMRVSTDSRTLSEPDGTLFVALRSARRDGNRYIAELYRRGVRAFLTDSPVDEKAYPLADSSAAPTRSKRCKGWPPITGPA